MPNDINRYIVITTIATPSNDIIEWVEKYSKSWNIVIVGDRKTPNAWNRLPVNFLSIELQTRLFPSLANLAPYDHYSRKNFGYLFALSKGAQYILETDDDNFPYNTFGKNIKTNVHGRLVGHAKWVNVYKYFSPENIWPRGLPLDNIHQCGSILNHTYEAKCLIQQYLVDDDPDVDAIWRLVFGNKSVRFNQDSSVIVTPGTWVPFNSQNTIFFSDAFPLMYLPHFTSFRMTDIWRSFVAQASLWAHGSQLAFHPPTAFQLRNPHNLMSDFEAEIIGYKNNQNICDALEEKAIELNGGDEKTISEIAKALWLHLIDSKFISKNEIPLINTWFDLILSIQTKQENET